MKKVSISSLLNPFVLAIPVAVAIVVLLPNFFDKFLLEVDQRLSLDKEMEARYFPDLNHDGRNEEITHYVEGLTQPDRFVVSTSEGGTVDQWNFSKNWVDGSRFFFGDYDQNGTDEVYGFTHSNDSIFLEGVDVLSNLDTLARSVFIDKIMPSRFDKNDYRADGGTIDNFDNDPAIEILVWISSHQNLEPRKLYLIDLQNNEVVKSPRVGIDHKAPVLIDLDADGRNEIIVSETNGAKQIHYPIDYPDSSAWLMVYDDDLNFKFDPIEFPGDRSSIKVIPMQGYLYVLWSDFGERIKPLKILKYSAKGERLLETEIPAVQNVYEFFSMEDYPESLFITRKGEFYQIDIKDLSLDKKEIPLLGWQSLPIDIDSDGRSEIVSSEQNTNKLNVFSQEFRHHNSIELDGKADPARMGNIHSADGKNRFVIKTPSSYYILFYYPNPLYWWKYPIWIGIYLSLVGFISLIQFIQTARLRKRQQLQDEIARLQLLNVRGQFDPHFTFNALNAIGSIIYKEEKEVAHDYFVKFSRLIRSVLENADQLETTLNEELEFVRNYLFLQKFRFKDKFDFMISVGEDVNLDSTHVPKMIIQNYAENSVKHGLKALEHGGLLSIVVIREGKNLKITVEDNGIGREAARTLHTDGTGKGLEITTRLYELYESIFNKKFRWEVQDLKGSDGTASGTRVNLWIPD